MACYTSGAKVDFGCWDATSGAALLNLEMLALVSSSMSSGFDHIQPPFAGRSLQTKCWSNSARTVLLL